MKVRRRIWSSRQFIQRSEFALVVASAVVGVAAVVTNPLAAVLPVAGTLVAVAMVWSIDKLQPLVSAEPVPDGGETPAGAGESDHVSPCPADD